MTEPRHEERAHSRLGASSSYRWMNCPGSVRETYGLDSTSEYAAQGTAAHELGERVLNATEVLYPQDFLGQEIVVGNHVFEVDEEMAEAVQVYVETLWNDHQEGDVFLVEKRFSLEQIRQGMFGTNDALIYRPATRKLTVYDYKHGAGKPVYPEQNPQLMYYGLGAALANSWPIEELELVIVQPRAGGDPVKRWTTDMLTLVGFMSALEVAADRASAPDAPLVPGEWCKSTFCPAAGTCAALKVQAREKAKLEFASAPASNLPREDMAAILRDADMIEAWVDAVRAEAYRQAEGGAPPPGWKLVEKVARRKWKDGDTLALELFTRFELGDEVYADPKLKSPAQIEKLIPKDRRGDLAALVEKVSSGTTLVRDTDRRPAVTRRSAADDFGSGN